MEKTDVPIVIARTASVAWRDEAIQYGLKGQKLIAQGNALGLLFVFEILAPCKGKSFCPFGAETHHKPAIDLGRCPGLMAVAPAGRFIKRHFSLSIF